jgi:hypothetical protein
MKGGVISEVVPEKCREYYTLFLYSKVTYILSLVFSRKLKVASCQSERVNACSKLELLKRNQSLPSFTSTQSKHGRVL